MFARLLHSLNILNIRLVFSLSPNTLLGMLRFKNAGSALDVWLLYIAAQNQNLYSSCPVPAFQSCTLKRHEQNLVCCNVCLRDCCTLQISRAVVSLLEYLKIWREEGDDQNEFPFGACLRACYTFWKHIYAWSFPRLSISKLNTRSTWAKTSAYLGHVCAPSTLFEHIKYPAWQPSPQLSQNQTKQGCDQN